MKISTEQLEKVKALDGKVTPSESLVEASVIKLMNAELIKKVTADVIAHPDREDMIAELKSRIEKGEYKVSADEIVDTMVRRAQADRIS